MHRLVAFASVFAAAVPLSADTAAGDCAPSGLTPKVLNGTTAIAFDGEGGVVVAAVAESKFHALEKGDVSVQAKWRLDHQGKQVAPKIETIAPGLSVYSGPGPVDLHDDTGKKLGSLKKGAKPPARMAAPKVKSIALASSMGRRMATQVAVTLDGDAPVADAVALVLADAKGTPRSWGQVSLGMVPKSVVFPFRTHSCMQVPNGTISSAVGDSVVVYWIDATGRKSEATKPMTIVAAPSP